MLNKHLLASALLLAATTSAQATELVDDRWYIAPFGSYVHTGGDRGAEEHGWGAGMGVGKMLNEHFNVELKGFYQEFASNTAAGDWRLAGGLADVQYYLSRGMLSPYTVIGIGGMNTELGTHSDPSFIGEAGAGFTFELSDNLMLRSDVRYRYNNNFTATFGRNTDEFHDMVVNVGFVVPIGEKPVAKARFEPPVPAPAPAPAAPDCRLLDDDRDGVNNCIDQCPDTIAGSKVDAQGCPISLELRGVTFKHDSAELTDNAKYILDGVAESLIRYPEKNDIEVRGHTSSDGSSAHNLRLSQRRSQSVVDYLRLRGVTNRMFAKGMGEYYPIADNETEAGRAANRRVELIWIDH